MKKGDCVKVNFISESRTEFSGQKFSGIGVIDRVEDGYVFGRISSTGIPFMCNECDVQVIEHKDAFEEWVKASPEFNTLIFSYGDRLFIKRDGEYAVLAVRLAHRLWLSKSGQIQALEELLWGA